MRLYTPKHLKYDDQDHITPNVEKNEGIRPWLGTTVAPYLPLSRYNRYDNDWFVVSTGKVMALAKDGFLVPAGLRIDMQAALDAGNVAAATLAYTAADVAAGVQNSNGVTCTNGEKVVASMIPVGLIVGSTGNAQRPVGGGVVNEVSYPIGIAPYSYYRAASDNRSPRGVNNSVYAIWSPTDQRYHNYQKQDRVTVLTDYVCEYPVLATYAPPFAGIAAFIGTTVKPGDFVSYDIDSNLCIGDPSGIWAPIIGQVLRVETLYPRNLLQRVKTRYDGSEGPDFNDLDKMPGTATGGLPDRMTYAGSTFGTVLVNLITR